MKTMVVRYKYKIFFLIFFVLWFFNGMTGFLSISKWNVFWYHQADSASIVLSDLIIDDTFPEYSKNFIQIMAKVAADKSPNLTNVDSVRTYFSHLGVQSVLLRPFFQLGTRVIFKDDPYSQWKSYRLTQVVVALATALVLALLLTFLAYEFGLFSVSIMGVWVIFTNVWLTIFARNIYWMAWSWFLPLLVVAYYLYQQNEKHYKYMYLFVFLTIALKASMGYEYLTTIMVMTTLPIFYFALSRMWTWKEFFSVFLKTSVACILGVVVTLIIHTILLGNFNIILDQLYWRTINTKSGDPNSDVTFTISSVLKMYFFNTIYNEIPFAIAVTFGVVFIFIRSLGQRFPRILQFFGTGIIIPAQKVLALYVIITLSFFGALSHHIIFMQHSGIHTHMNYVLWFMPFWFLMVLAVLCSVPNKEEILSFVRPILQIFTRKKND